ncbi:MAG: NADP-dependent oxidoreductase [Pseudomonadota bacterium]
MSTRPTHARHLTLHERPLTLPERAHFKIQHVPLEHPARGQITVQVRYAALSPWQGQRLKDFRNFTRPFAIGELIDCDVLAEVIESRADGFEPGQLVVGRLGWRDYATVATAGLTPIDRHHEFDELLWLTALSSPGLTAYCGMDLFGRPMPGQTLVVTSAAGSVGSYAVQLGKLAGARVIGIAGGPEKCRHVEQNLGADVCIDHRAEDFEDRLARAAAEQVHLFFDTVGGPIADAVFDQLARYARVLFVGRTASNNSDNPASDPINLRQLWAREASLQCFSRYSYDERWQFARERMIALCHDGKIQSQHNIVEGFEATPEALRDMLAGRFTGKVLVSYLAS